MLSIPPSLYAPIFHGETSRAPERQTGREVYKIGNDGRHLGDASQRQSEIDAASVTTSLLGRQDSGDTSFKAQACSPRKIVGIFREV